MTLRGIREQWIEANDICEWHEDIGPEQIGDLMRRVVEACIHELRDLSAEDGDTVDDVRRRLEALKEA